jgi:hypothetical protein
MESNKREKQLARQKAWRDANKEKRSAYFKKWKSENIEKRREYCKDYRSNNSDRLKEYNKNWRELNEDHIKEHNKEYYKNNRGRRSFYERTRQANKLNAMPSWLNDNEKQQIKDMYERCSEITKTTGIPHHVDHIYPLQGEYSCGLHVPWNLQIISASANSSKKNRIIEAHAPYCSELEHQ